MWTCTRNRMPRCNMYLVHQNVRFFKNYHIFCYFIHKITEDLFLGGGDGKLRRGPRNASVWMP
jgi:hypothetical protein